eukprot:16442-Heterococcus_DN1.PRE.9
MHQADAPAHGCTSYVLSIIVAAFLISETSAFHTHTVHTVHTRLCELACKAGNSDQQSTAKNTAKQQQQPTLRPKEQRLPATVRRLNDWSDAPAAVVVQKPTAAVAARQRAQSTTQQPKQAAAQQPRAVRMSRVELQAILTRLQSETSHTVISEQLQSMIVKKAAIKFSQPACDYGSAVQYPALIKLAGRANDYNMVTQMRVDAHKGLYCICWLLLNAFHTQLVGRMEQTHRNNLNVCAYSTAVSVVGTAGKQWQQAFAIFNRIKQKGLAVDVVAYRSCIMMLQANDQWQSAVEVLQAMILDKTQPDVNSLNAVIDVCLKNQQWRVGLRLYEMAPKWGVVCDIYTYSTAIRCCAQGHEWQRAIQQAGVAPNVITYSSAITACDRAGEWQQALQLLKHMTDVAAVQPNAVTYSAVMSALARKGRYSEAMELLNTIKQRSTFVPTKCVHSQCVLLAASAIIKAYIAMHCQRSLAIKSLKDMKECGIHPDITVYHAVLSACASFIITYPRDMLTRCTLSPALHDGLKPTTTTYNLVMTACENAANYAKAYELYEAMQHAHIPLDAVSYSFAFLRAHDWHKAKAILATIESKGLQLNQAQRWQVVLSMFTKITSKGITVSLQAYNAVINAAAKVWYFISALNCRSKSRLKTVSTVCCVPQKYPVNCVCVTAIFSTTVAVVAFHVQSSKLTQYWCVYDFYASQLGDLGQALSLLRNMLKYGLVADTFSYTSAITACQQPNQCQTAIQLLREMQDKKIAVSAVTYVAVIDAVLCSNDHLDTALDLYSEMKQINAVAIDTNSIVSEYDHTSIKLKHMENTLQCCST